MPSPWGIFGGGASDGKVKVTAGDTANYLAAKLAAGSGVTLATIPGEQVEISAAGGSATFPPIDFVYYVGTPATGTPNGSIRAPFATMADALIAVAAVPVGTGVCIKIPAGDYSAEAALVFPAGRYIRTEVDGPFAVFPDMSCDTTVDGLAILQFIDVISTGTQSLVVTGTDPVEIYASMTYPWQGLVFHMIDASAPGASCDVNGVNHGFINTNIPSGGCNFTNCSLGDNDISEWHDVINCRILGLATLTSHTITSDEPPRGFLNCTFGLNCTLNFPDGALFIDGVSKSSFENGGGTYTGSFVNYLDQAIGVKYDDGSPNGITVQQAIAGLAPYILETISVNVNDSASDIFMGAGTTHVPESQGGPDLIVEGWAAWDPGDILLIEWGIGVKSNDGNALGGFFYPVLSDDNGVTYTNVAGLIGDLGLIGVGVGQKAVGGSFSQDFAVTPSAGTPKVKIAANLFSNNWQIDFAAGSLCYIRCYRIKAGTYVPAGLLW